MGKFNGFNTGASNMQGLMRQAQRMQQEVARVQEEVGNTDFEASVGGGAVKVVVNGNKEFKSIEISPAAVDPDDVEMLQDLILSAVNEAVRLANETMEKEMSKVTGGLGNLLILRQNKMESLDRLISRLNRLPGIGIKTAQRLAYHIISLPDEDAAALANSIEDAHRLVHFCPICGNYTENEVCEICSDPKRSSDTLCVVKDARDVIFMERMREYHGRYHVLGGVLSPMDGIGPEMLRINELCKRIECEKVKEVILATNPDVEGETTANYIAKLLKPLGVRVTRIAHGIPIGGSLEYIDEVTLLRSIENRREM